MLFDLTSDLHNCILTIAGNEIGRNNNQQTETKQCNAKLNSQLFTNIACEIDCQRLHTYSHMQTYLYRGNKRVACKIGSIKLAKPIFIFLYKSRFSPSFSRLKFYLYILLVQSIFYFPNIFVFIYGLFA